MTIENSDLARIMRLKFVSKTSQFLLAGFFGNARALNITKGSSIILSITVDHTVIICS